MGKAFAAASVKKALAHDEPLPAPPAPLALLTK
jgi:hypothetical protein